MHTQTHPALLPEFLKIEILHNDNKPKLHQTWHTKTPLKSIRVFFRLFIHGKEGSHFTDIFTYI